MDSVGSSENGLIDVPSYVDNGGVTLSKGPEVTGILVTSAVFRESGDGVWEYSMNVGSAFGPEGSIDASLGVIFEVLRDGPDGVGVADRDADELITLSGYAVDLDVEVEGT